MTDKRFTHRKWYDERRLFDGDESFAIVDSDTQAIIICNKLNELNDEANRLRKSLKSADELILYIYNEIKEEGSMEYWRIQELIEL